MAETIRKLATLERIIDINPILDADSIERVTIRGWNVVVNKGNFKVGDLVIYCEIDSLMPERPEFEFLRPRGFRIRTIKLRGQVSQGIVFPLTILESIGKFQSVIGDLRWETLLLLNISDKNGNTAIPIVEGEDLTEALGITKYEPPIPAELSGIAKGLFPSHSIKSDEERVQNLTDHYDEYKKNTWIATEKLDGTNGNFFIYNNEFSVASRNLELKENETNSFWKVARQINLEEKMRNFMHKNSLGALTIQGELIGEGIQKNKYKLKGQEIRFFRAFDPIKYQFFPYDYFLVMMIDMDLKTVPIINNNFTLPESYNDLISYADGQSKLVDAPREGIVFVAKNPSYNNNGRLSFKVLSNKFLLKHEE